MGTSVGTSSTRLITLRGSSGSGKSVVAAAIRASRPAGSVAIIGQDVIRREILSSGQDAGGHPIGLIEVMSRFLLDQGFDVIIEGILNADWYAEMLSRLNADHQGVGRSYLWDLSFEETLRRHATKPVATAFGETELRAWWRGCQPIAELDEAVITADESLEAAATRIVRDCWPVAS